MSVSRGSTFKIFSCFVTVYGKLKHFFPVNSVSCLSHFVVNIPCTLYALCNIGSVCSYLACNYTLFYIIEVWQTQMLSRSYIAEKIRTACSSYRTAYSTCYVVIAGSNIGYERA